MRERNTKGEVCLTPVKEKEGDGIRLNDCLVVFGISLLYVLSIPCIQELVISTSTIMCLTQERERVRETERKRETEKDLKRDETSQICIPFLAIFSICICNVTSLGFLHVLNT